VCSTFTRPPTSCSAEPREPGYGSSAETESRDRLGPARAGPGTGPKQHGRASVWISCHFGTISPMKKAILAVLVVFLGFWLFNDPHSLATTAKTAGGHGVDGASAFMTAVINFIKDL
jgi:hypothetical protein